MNNAAAQFYSTQDLQGLVATTHILFADVAASCGLKHRAQAYATPNPKLSTILSALRAHPDLVATLDHAGGLVLSRRPVEPVELTADARATMDLFDVAVLDEDATHAAVGDERWTGRATKASINAAALSAVARAALRVAPDYIEVDTDEGPHRLPVAPMADAYERWLQAIDSVDLPG